MSNKHQVLQNPDVPAEAIVKQLLVENGQLKSEIQYLENELANKNRAIKAFKKWQRDVASYNIHYWLGDGLRLLDYPKPLSSKAIELLNNVFAKEKRYKSKLRSILDSYNNLVIVKDDARENEEITDLLTYITSGEI